MDKRNQFRKVLAIESSCDDTSVSVVNDNGFVDSVVCASQDKEHEVFGGIVPEIASRNHSFYLLPLIEQALKKANTTWNEIDGIAVTNEPGLIGSLLVGVVTAKTLAYTKKKALIGVNHLEGHLLAPFLSDYEFQPPKDFSYPYVALAVSGGHSSIYWVKALGDYEVVGSTIDDAAGEAFDKFAKITGLGYPGGIKVDQHAKTGDPEAYKFPRALMQKGNYNFSFSGLKTQAQILVQKLPVQEKRDRINDLCASYQEAIVDALIIKMSRVADLKFTNNEKKKIIVTGGVSANSRLREKVKQWSIDNNAQYVIPPIRYCTDNAAMIGFVGIQRLNRGERSELNLVASPKSSLMRTNV